MTRKDYLAAVTSLREQAPRMTRETREAVVEALVAVFSADNARFSAARFVQACEAAMTARDEEQAHKRDETEREANVDRHHAWQQTGGRDLP